MRCSYCGCQIEQRTIDGFKLCEPCNQASIERQQRAWQTWLDSEATRQHAAEREERERIAYYDQRQHQAD